ncbi:MAG: aconitate hydratase [Erysipelotrichaceae bacterium]
MGKSLAYKIMENNLLQGTVVAGHEVAVHLNQTLTQDSTGTMVYLQLLAMNPSRIKTELSVAYIDHNMIQSGFENADDHEFLQSVAARYGIIFSKPGGGICHQVHLERFAKPGAILIGSDSHTPTCGGLGSLAIGAGGLDVAVGMAKGLYFMTVPKVCRVNLIGKPRPWLNGKDIILKILQLRSVKGAIGFIMEYSGEALRYLSVTDRATICNMGAELGATTSIFPSDENTLDYLTKQGRPHDYQPMAADDDAVYDEELTLDLSDLVPMVARPHSPDNVVEVREIVGLKIDQVAIGSCTNSSYSDMMKVAAILKGKQVHPDVSLVISPGSANVLKLISANGALTDMIQAGARILESACGPCIGMGQAPKSGGISLRSFNRNFIGRSGTADAQVYLVSPQTAAYSAINGVLSDPMFSNADMEVIEPLTYGSVDNYFVFVDPKKIGCEPLMGPNIKPFPLAKKIAGSIEKSVLLKVGDNITTDDIVPSTAKLLPYRSNIPYLATFCFKPVTPDFFQHAQSMDGGFIVAGDNYGQGSSREHAALIPLYLGVRAVFAKSFARIHRANLINVGIIPMTFLNAADYDTIDIDDVLVMDGVNEALNNHSNVILVNKTKDRTYEMVFNGSQREQQVALNGGYLNFISTLDLGKHYD